MWRKPLAYALGGLGKWLDWASIVLTRRAHQISAHPYQAELLKEIKDYTQSIEKFVKEPTDLAGTVRKHEYKDAVRIYFMMKRAVAIAEAFDKKASVQLSNEMRNAFDHFVRSLIVYGTPAENTEKKHVDRMIGHLQRGILDAIKLSVASLDEQVSEHHKALGHKALGLVDNGRYIIEIAKLQSEARRVYVHAREQEFNLGTEAGDEDVVKHYLVALVATKAMYDHYVENSGNMAWAKHKTVVYVSLGFLSLFVIELVSHIFSFSVVSALAEQGVTLLAKFGIHPKVH